MAKTKPKKKTSQGKKPLILGAALYALLLLVVSGLVGRLLDARQARVIATEANSNGVGIIQTVEERLHDLELTVERLSAGKSPAFKIFRSEALRTNTSLPAMSPVLAPNELDDFERVYEVLTQRAYLARSLRRHFRISAPPGGRPLRCKRERSRARPRRRP